MRTSISFNVSEGYHSAPFFESLQCNLETFNMLRGAVANKTMQGVTGVMQPSKVFTLYSALKNNTATMTISQRRGYKVVTFTD